MATTAQREDPAVLLKLEHAVACVLAQVPEPTRAYSRLLEAIGAALGWEFAAAWEVTVEGTMRCAATWSAGGVDSAALAAASWELAFCRGEGLPGRVWATGRPAGIPELAAEESLPRLAAARHAGLRSALCFPVRGASSVIGAIELFARQPRRSDRAVLATTTSLGRHIGQHVERRRAQRALHDSDARKSAILDAAFDCVITMDHRGRVVEVNAATERTFGHLASAMAGRELAELIIPPELRAAHRRGLERYLQTGRTSVLGRRIELTGVRADGKRFPVELAITRPRLDGPPLFIGYLRDITERRRAEDDLRALAEEQAALRRVATAVAGAVEARRVFSLVTEEVGRLLGAHTANMIRYEEGPWASVVGGWSADGVPKVEVGSTVPLDSETTAVHVWRTGQPARLDSYEGLKGELAAKLRSLGFTCAVAAPIMLAGRLWGAVLVSSVNPEPFPPGAEQRIAKFAELVAQALANAEAREQLSASRARIVQAADTERRRLERNLHDGAQQRLVALSLMVRLAERRLPADANASRALLADAGTEFEQALAELRELAQGLHPGILIERGLAPALSALAARAPVPVDLTVGLDDRLPEPVEVATYYVVAEALTNVAKYARASAARVSVERADGELLVTVADDGIGGADGTAGSGLRGLADRVEALGGRLELRSPAGSGTTLRARLPCLTT
jgi:PAS domain S-box-containing protein